MEVRVLLFLRGLGPLGLGSSKRGATAGRFRVLAFSLGAFPRLPQIDYLSHI
jgi:hypothetical protein